jgi:hypothetical protein
MLLGWVLKSKVEHLFIHFGVDWLAVTQLFGSL